MISNEEYRVLEYIGKFFPQKQVSYPIIRLFRKTKYEKRWSKITDQGTPLLEFINSFPPAIYFTTLNGARLFLEKLGKGEIEHEAIPKS